MLFRVYIPASRRPAPDRNCNSQNKMARTAVSRQGGKGSEPIASRREGKAPELQGPTWERHVAGQDLWLVRAGRD